MQTTIKIFSLVLFFLVATLSVQAQKYAHMNLGNLLAELPEVKAGETELEATQLELTKIGQEMVLKFQKDMATAQQAIDAGQWAPARIQEEQSKLQQAEQQIRVYEQEVMKKIQVKREEILGPILQKIENTIKAVAQEKGYAMVFDTSVYNAVLFAEESVDIMAEVKSRL